MKPISELALLLRNPKNIIIITHVRPDGDALGSSLAASEYLKLKGHKVDAVIPSASPSYLRWMPGNSSLLVFKDNPDYCRKIISEADLIFCLDINGFGRTDKAAETLSESKAVKIMIDHHMEPENFDDYRLWNIKASSTCELVFDFIEIMGDVNMINKSIAMNLYTGIVTDSGNFRHSTTSAGLHRKVAKLIDTGVNSSFIHQKLYDSNSESRLRLLGYCLDKKLEIIKNFNTAIISLSLEEQNKFDAEEGDTEGIVNYALSINNIVFAAFIIDSDSGIRLSLRSKGPFPVNEIAKKYFCGGGHLNAAGGIYGKSLSNAVEKLKSILPVYGKLLTNNKEK